MEYRLRRLSFYSRLCVLIHIPMHGGVSMSKKRTNISINPDVYEKAKELGMNISQTSERALQIRIASTQRGTHGGETPAPLGLTLAEQNPSAPTPGATDQLDADEFLTDFEQTCRIDWNYAKSTTRERMRYAEKLVEHLDGHPLTASKQDLRTLLQQYNDENAIKTIRIIYGKYFSTEIAESFELPPSPPKPKKSPTKDELIRVYQEIDSAELHVAFLILATSGIRRREMIELTTGDFDRSDRMLSPSTEDGQRTKRQWLTFYSAGTETKLEQVYEFSEMSVDEPLFSYHRDTLTRRIRQASERAGTMTITPQTLRVWFCNEMSRLGVPDRYIDAFCGRTPSSALAKHYSDYTPRKLQDIYENAGLSVLP